MCDMTHSYMWYDRFIHVMWLIQVWDNISTTARAPQHPLLCETTWIYQIYLMSGNYIWYRTDFYMKKYVHGCKSPPGLIHMWDNFIWLIVWDKFYMTHDSFLCETISPRLQEQPGENADSAKRKSLCVRETKGTAGSQCVCIWVCTCKYICMNIYLLICVFIFIHICINKNVYIHIYEYMYTYICIDIYIYTYIYTYTHTQI